VSTEEERALEHRRSHLARKAATKAAEAALKGDPAARRALTEAWEPLQLAARERAGEGPDEC